jgi:hypothetical protein
MFMQRKRKGMEQASDLASKTYLTTNRTCMKKATGVISSERASAGKKVNPAVVKRGSKFYHACGIGRKWLFCPFECLHCAGSPKAFIDRRWPVTL